MNADFQRLDTWLYYARFAKQRGLCAAYIARGGVRINREPTAKPHAKLRIDDVLTLPPQYGGDRVRVWRIRKLGKRRGPASEASQLYENLDDTR